MAVEKSGSEGFRFRSVLHRLNPARGPQTQEAAQNEAPPIHRLQEMTDAQEEAREKAKEILDEHFAGWVLVVLGEEENDNHESSPAAWGGGFALAIGLLEVGKTAIISSRFEKNDPQD